MEPLNISTSSCPCDNEREAAALPVRPGRRFALTLLALAVWVAFYSQLLPLSRFLTYTLFGHLWLNAGYYNMFNASVASPMVGGGIIMSDETLKYLIAGHLP